MTKVLVHGNPETADIWGPLIGELHGRGIDDVVTLSPPGFGAPCPADWSATPGAYVDWLRGELAEIESPVDLLGHDWGAGHVLGLAAADPAAFRSWSVDCAGLVHPDYVWHDAAQAWQTDELGEAVIEQMLALTNDERVDAYKGLGMTAEIAGPVADAFTPEMGRCILELYRGAAQPAMVQLGDRLEAADRRPSLIIEATDDPYVPRELIPDVARRYGSQVHTLEGQGHWWMLSVPSEAAGALADFWRQLD